MKDFYQFVSEYYEKTSSSDVKLKLSKEELKMLTIENSFNYRDDELNSFEMFKVSYMGSGNGGLDEQTLSTLSSNLSSTLSTPSKIEKRKQINNKQYTISDSREKVFYRINIHPSLVSLLKNILRKNPNNIIENETSSSVVISTPPSMTGMQVQEDIFGELTNLFLNGNKELTKFVGSSEYGDFIDSDFNVSIQEIRG